MQSRLLKAVFAGLLSLTVIGVPSSGIAEVNVNIGVNFGPPPPVVIHEPPVVVVVPGTYVYFAPDVQVDILFFHGYWYRPHEGRWYRATGYNGPWVYLEPAHVPGVIVHLPPNYHHVPPGHQRIPYGQLKKNWSTWEKEKHWDRHDAKVEHRAAEHKAGNGKGNPKHH